MIHMYLVFKTTMFYSSKKDKSMIMSSFPATLRCNGENNNCCTPNTPCDDGDGDCDTDADCKDGLMCGTNNCKIKTGLYDWDDADDCCTKKG